MYKLDNTSVQMYNEFRLKLPQEAYVEFLNFYTSVSGNSPVEDYMGTIDDQEIYAHIDVLFEKIDTEGARYLIKGAINTKPMEGINGLFEIKVSAHRFFYLYGDGNSVWIIHAIEKKQKKTPAADIKTCKKRISDLKKRQLI